MPFPAACRTTSCWCQAWCSLCQAGAGPQAAALPGSWSTAWQLHLWALTSACQKTVQQYDFMLILVWFYNKLAGHAAQIACQCEDAVMCCCPEQKTQGRGKARPASCSPAALLLPPHSWLPQQGWENLQKDCWASDIFCYNVNEFFHPNLLPDSFTL